MSASVSAAIQSIRMNRALGHRHRANFRAKHHSFVKKNKSYSSDNMLAKRFRKGFTVRRSADREMNRSYYIDIVVICLTISFCLGGAVYLLL